MESQMHFSNFARNFWKSIQPQFLMIATFATRWKKSIIINLYQKKKKFEPK